MKRQTIAETVQSCFNLAKGLHSQGNWVFVAGLLLGTMILCGVQLCLRRMFPLHVPVPSLPTIIFFAFTEFRLEVPLYCCPTGLLMRNKKMLEDIYQK